MNRKLLNLATGLSLLLLLLTVLAWFESHVYITSFTAWPTRAKVMHGDLFIEHSLTWVGQTESGFAISDFGDNAGSLDRSFYDILGGLEWSILGVECYSVMELPSFTSRPMTATNPPPPPPPTPSGWALIIALWQLAILFAVLPLLWLVWFRRQSKRYRIKRGLCPGCGYDLRGNTNTAACPECGKTVISAAPVSKVE